MPEPLSSNAPQTTASTVDDNQIQPTAQPVQPSPAQVAPQAQPSPANQAALSTAPKMDYAKPANKSLFDRVLNSMSGAPTVADPQTGEIRQVPMTRKTMSQHILAGAITSILQGAIAGGQAGSKAQDGSLGTKGPANMAALGAGAQVGQQTFQQMRNAPQAALDLQMIRKAAAIKNTTDELRNQMMADKLHEDDWSRKEDYYTKTKDVWQPVMDTLEQSDKDLAIDSGNPRLLDPNLRNLSPSDVYSTMGKPGNVGKYSPIQDGWTTETHSDGRTYHLPTFSLVANGPVNVTRDTLMALSPFNSGVKDLLDKTTRDSVQLPSTMLIGLEKSAQAAHGAYEFINQIQTGLGVDADKQLSQSAFNEKFRTNPALQRQVASLADTLGNVGTQSTAHALAQIQASGKAGEIFKLIGVSPDKVQEFIDDKQNEAVQEAAKAKNAGKAMTLETAKAILAEPNESPDRKKVAQALLDQDVRQAARKSGAEATARTSAEGSEKAKQEFPEIESVAQALAKGDLTSLKDVTSMRGDQRAKVFARAKELNPNFNTKDVDLKVKTQTAYSTGSRAIRFRVSEHSSNMLVMLLKRVLLTDGRIVHSSTGR